MKKDLVNINNELAHCEAQLSAIRIVTNITSVDPQPVTADHTTSEELPSQGVTTSGETPDVAATSQPLLAEYKEVIADLEKSNMEFSSLNEQLANKVVNLENEKTSLTEELQRLQVELQELKGGAVSVVGEDIQMSDGTGGTIKMISKGTTEEDDKSGEKSEEESEGEQEEEITSVQLEESITDKEQVQSEVSVTVIEQEWLVYS